MLYNALKYYNIRVCVRRRLKHFPFNHRIPYEPYEPYEHVLVYVFESRIRTAATAGTTRTTDFARSPRARVTVDCALERNYVVYGLYGRRALCYYYRYYCHYYRFARTETNTGADGIIENKTYVYGSCW